VMDSAFAKPVRLNGPYSIAWLGLLKINAQQSQKEWTKRLWADEIP
jgi:hypothetical protein